MIRSANPRMRFSALRRYSTLLFVAVALSIGCAGPPPEPPPPPPPAVSLLLMTPLVGDETEPRDPPPETTRMLLEDESVVGWRSPEESALRFPVELRAGARLSFRLGGSTEVPIRMNDLTMRVEYLPESGPMARDADSPDPIIVFEAAPERCNRFFQEWYDVDIALSQAAPSEGELRFVVDGPLASDPGVKILWGQPVIYHQSERRSRNVLVIGVDTLRADALSLYGGKAGLNPNIEEFSRTGTLFLEARSQSPWTLPSFGSMLTGRLPSAISCAVYTGHVPDRAVMLGEMLLPHGYATQAVCSNIWVGNEECGFQQGMETLWFASDAPAQVSVSKAKEFIARSQGRDWFCFLHFMDPHAPYTPPAQLAKKHIDAAYDGPYALEFRDMGLWKTGGYTPEPADVEHVKNLYRAEVANLDSALEDLFDFLESHQLTEETLVVFAADHGEEFFDHGGFEHGHTQFDELVHVPLIVRGPGFPLGEQIDTSVGNFDIAPTILTYLDLPIPNDLVGMPLQKVVRGEVENERHIYGEDNSRGEPSKYVLEWPHKCVLNYLTGEAQLYNLVDDPEEKANIAEENPNLMRRLYEDMVRAMLPSETAFHVWISRGYNEEPHRFTGTLRVHGGIERARGFRMEEGDSYTVEGDTITFDIMSAVGFLGPNKHFMITPSPGADSLTARVRVDGEIVPERFMPYGSRTPEPSGTATVQIDDFALGPDLSLAFEEFPSACYLWGVRGYDEATSFAELDAETIEQLKALGYLQ